MLTGKLHYKTPTKTYHYNVEAIDNLTTLSLRLTSGDYDAMQFLMDGEHYLETMHCDVNQANVLISTILGKDEKGKTTKTPVNQNFFCRLGATIRYVKNNCTTKHLDGFMALKLASGEFSNSVDKEYHIPFPTNKKQLAHVKLAYEEILYISIKTDEFELELDNNAEPVLFQKLKATECVKLGFRFNTEYLGFECPTEEPAPINTQDAYKMHTCIEDIVAAHPEKEFSWLLKKDYRIVTDENLEEVCNYIMNWDGYVYYDTETTGLKINFLSRTGKADQLVGVVLSVKYGESFFFPTQMKSIPNLCNGDHFYFMEKYMRPILEGKKLVAHNAPFDWKVAYIYDINANIVHDTMAILNLTFATKKKNYPVNLKANAKTLLGRDSLELSDLLVDGAWGKDTDIKFWDLPYELVRLYACADTDNTNGLLEYCIQNDVLHAYGAERLYEIELPFSLAVAYQEFYGHLIDVKHLDEIKSAIHTEQSEVLEKMEGILGHKFNPNSPAQLKTAMYEELGIPTQIDRMSGKVTTNKETLTYLAELTDAEDEPMYPFAGLMKRYRELEGVRKIADKLPEYMDENGYVFSKVNQFGASTGRVSINEPNYQSYNDPIKKNVIPRPGFYMFDTDYSSVEYRVLGNMVGNKRIMESFKDPDFDYHQYQAARMYGVPYATVTKKMRKAAKGINFGLPYGMGDESLGARVFGEATPENTKKAAALRAAYFKGQEDIRDWFEFHRDKGVNLGYTETYFGRRRYYDKAKESVGRIRRQAGNQVIQGSAADIYKLAVGNVFKRICKEGWLGKVLFVGFIHDELLGEVSNDINPGIFLKMLREEFEVKVTNEDGTPWCPLYMGFGYGMSWYEAKSVELPIKLQWEFVEKYGTTGFPEWDGNGRKFCDTIPIKLRDFDVRDIGYQLLDKDSQGKDIKVTLNSQMFDCLSVDKKEYDAIVPKMVEEGKSYEDIVAALNEKFIQLPLINAETNQIETTFEIPKGTQDGITLFCRLHNLDRNSINVLDLPQADMSKDIDTSNVMAALEEENTASAEQQLQTMLTLFGYFTDIASRTIYMCYPNDAYLKLIIGKTNKTEVTANDYKLVFIDTDGICDSTNVGKVYTTNVVVPNDALTVVQQVIVAWVKNGRPKNNKEDNELTWAKYGYSIDPTQNTIIIRTTYKALSYLEYKYFKPLDSEEEGYIVYLYDVNTNNVVSWNVKLPYFNFVFFNSLVSNPKDIAHDLIAMDNDPNYQKYYAERFGNCNPQEWY